MRQDTVITKMGTGMRMDIPQIGPTDLHYRAKGLHQIVRRLLGDGLASAGLDGGDWLVSRVNEDHSLILLVMDMLDEITLDEQQMERAFPTQAGG